MTAIYDNDGLFAYHYQSVDESEDPIIWQRGQLITDLFVHKKMLKAETGEIDEFIPEEDVTIVEGFSFKTINAKCKCQCTCTGTHKTTISYNKYFLTCCSRQSGSCYCKCTNCLCNFKTQTEDETLDVSINGPDFPCKKGCGYRNDLKLLPNNFDQGFSLNIDLDRHHQIKPRKLGYTYHCNEPSYGTVIFDLKYCYIKDLAKTESEVISNNLV